MFFIKKKNLDGLENLKSLKTLWIGQNSIETLKNYLESLKNLTDLNISGNKICSFKETLSLSRLPNLKILAFFDPTYGDNPICTLSNYNVLEFILLLLFPKDIYFIPFEKYWTIGYIVNFWGSKIVCRSNVYEEKDVL